MRRLISAAVAGLAVATAPADDPKPKADPPAKAERPEKAEPTLKVGDTAPVLKADKWLQGAEVKGFAAGKVYVVEFWATWCGPCIVMMPHLADLAEEYAPKGVTVIGYSAKDPNNTREKVEKFVERRGPKLGYTMAYADDRETYDAWMKAAGQNGIPCSFVVGKDGRVAYIGHPVYLDEVLPKVLAGTWGPDAQAALEADKKAYETAAAAAAKAGPAEQLKVDAEWAAKRPSLVNNPYSVGPKLGLLVKAEKFADAKAMAAGAVAKGTKRGDTSGLSAVATVLSRAKGQPELTALAVSATEAQLQAAGEDDVRAALAARSVYGAVGQADKAKELAARAVRLADADLKAAGEGNLSALLTAHSIYTAAGEADSAKGLAAKAVPLAEKAVTGDKDYRNLLTLARVYKAAGDADKAKAAAQRAVDNAPSEPAQLRRMLAQQAKVYGAEPKPDADKKDK